MSANQKPREKTKKILIYVAVIITMVVLFIPFFWMVITSFMSEREIYSNNYPDFHVFPRYFSLDNYVHIFTAEPEFYHSFLNSVMVSIPTVMIVTPIAVLAAYGISRLRWKNKGLVMFALLFTSMIPTMGILIPYYLIMINIGLYDTRSILILTYVAYRTPYCVWIMKGFFDTIPAGLEEAGMIDGCTRLQTLWRIILPLSLPGVAATAIFAFVNSWNEFLMALVLTEDVAKTFPVWIGTFIGMYKVSFAQLIAAGVISCVPVVVIALLFEKWIISGLIEGAVKG